MDIKDLTITAINEVMDATQLDERAYKIAADKVKEEIPGKNMEPLMGRILEGVGKELQKPEETA